MSTSSDENTMRAVVTPKSGPPSVLEVRTLPIPVPDQSQVLIQVKAFGLNRSELFTRQGHSPGVTWPRIQGIEAVGIVASCPSGKFSSGAIVATAMGGLGRAFDGGYAEYTCVPVDNVQQLSIPSISDLGGWAVLGAMPEMLQTAYGSLYKALRIQKGEHLLVRGGTTSIGLAAAGLAKAAGLTVTSTTRRDDKATAEVLHKAGADNILIDTGSLSSSSSSTSTKYDKVLELIGVKTLRDSLAVTNPGGIVCNTGIVAGTWELGPGDRNPMELIPNGVCLTSYGGSEKDFMTTPLQEMVDKVLSGEMIVPVGNVFKGLESVKEAHELMESNKASGKVVVVVGED